MDPAFGSYEADTVWMRIVLAAVAHPHAVAVDDLRPPRDGTVNQPVYGLDEKALTGVASDMVQDKATELLEDEVMDKLPDEVKDVVPGVMKKLFGK